MQRVETRKTQAERRDEAEKRLIEAGVHVLAELGIERVTLASVGAAAGFSRGLTNHYFGSKQAFQRKVAIFIGEQFETRFLMSALDPGYSSLLQLINNLFVRAMNDPLSRDLLRIALSDEPLKDAHMGRQLAPVRQRAHQLFQLHVTEAIKSNDGRVSVDPGLVTSMILGATCAALRVALASPRQDWAVIADKLSDFISSGLAANGNHPDHYKTR